MVDRVPSDHPTVRTIRTEVVRHGGRRRRLELPPDATEVLPEDGTIEVRVDDHRRFARCRRVDDRSAIVGLYETHSGANGDTEGTDGLRDWLDASERPVGSSVLLDIVADGTRIGLRVPGQRVVYESPQTRDDSLADIARKFTENE